MAEFVSISPEIYRKNAFRLLGLPTIAGLKQIKRRASLLVSLIESGEASSLDEYVLGGVTEMPDEPVIREASHRLESPEDRLLDEVFWFRTDDEDAGLDLVSAGIRGQILDWLETEALGDTDATVATHNLAVFYHVAALQIEAAISADIPDNDPLLPAYHADAAAAWRKVFAKFRNLHRSDQFTDWLQGRFDTVSKGRLDESSFEDLKDLLLVGPLSQVVTIAFAFGRKGRLGELERLRRTALDNRVSKAKYSETAEELLQEPADQLLKSVEAVQSDIGSDPETAEQKATELMDRTLVDLDALAALLGKDHHLVAVVGDALATAVNSAQLEISDQLKDHATSRQLLLRAKPYARSPELVPVLENNLSYLTCQFCREAAREEGEAYALSMSRIVSYTPALEQFQVEKSTINVPRCGDCRREGRFDMVRARGFPPAKERLDQGWLAKSEPDESDLLDFLQRNS